MFTKIIIVYGTTYELNSIILLKSEENSMPVFGQITKIYIYGEDFFLLYKEYDTLYYCPMSHPDDNHIQNHFFFSQ